MIDFKLDKLPQLPQLAQLRILAEKVWQDNNVEAMWLGGSFASGKADRYSDVDLRLSVSSEHLLDWHKPDFKALFGRPILMQATSMANEDAVLHHLLLDNCDAYDLWVQKSEGKLSDEPKFVMACRDTTLAERLAVKGHEGRLNFQEVRPEAIRHGLISYWANFAKNPKVLNRDLHMIWRDGLYLFSGFYLRLKFIEATGEDCGNVTIPPMTIHTITPIIQILRNHYGDELLQIVSQPMQNRQECEASIERLSVAIGETGRSLAHTYQFEYPIEIEQAVLKYWAKFKEESAND